MSTVPSSYHMLKLVGWIILSIAMPGFMSGSEVTRITVDAAQALGPVNRLVFGHNLEAADSYGVFATNHTRSETGAGVWNPETGAPVPEAVRYAVAIGMPVLRYPGGCLVHGFDWKQTIGPVAERPQFRFGLDEFLAYCQVLKAMPLITVSDYTGTAQDAADLVEYLNAPADAGHPWARKRAANGHPQPYGVRHFELGNESDHGNHDLKPTRKFAADAYAEWVNAYAAKMRAVDPTIRLSALMGTGTGPDDPWNDVVLAGTKGSVDFIAIHTYAVALWREEQVRPYPEAMLMRACMASVDQFEVMLGKYREKIKRHTGKDLPLAITEYNAALVQEKPVPYRFSFAAALFSADYLRVLLKPDANVLMANYWQFINGYWGMVKCTRPYEPNKDHEWSVRPAYALYRLWGQHFGQVLLKSEVRGAPRIELPRQVGTALSAVGTTHEKARPISGNLLAGKTLKTPSGEGYSVAILRNGAIHAPVKKLDAAQYLPLATIPALPGSTYELSLKARVKGEVGSARLGIGMVDARGWKGTLSGTSIDVPGSVGSWTPFSTRMVTAADCSGLDLTLRLLPGDAPPTGMLEIRDLSVRAVSLERFPAYEAVTAAGSRSEDGKTVYMIVFNKHETEALPIEIDLRNFAPTSAARWCVTSPSMTATNLPTNPAGLTDGSERLTIVPGQSVFQTLPACSMTAFEFRRE